ncbi:uncharacterized protein [Onthophagus taurus]|uniref:uncharacterized protein n=1 Tax=Onthophagus taurus TaxID=166361 RepID=UPI0039BDD161
MMKSILLVISLLFCNSGCYHLLVAENLRNDFLKLHAKIVSNDTFRLGNGVTSILQAYKPFLDEFEQAEKNLLNFEFIINNPKYSNLLNDDKIHAINDFFKVFVDIVNKPNNKRNAAYFEKVEQFKKPNFKNQLKDLRDKTKNVSYFNTFLKIDDENISEQYSKYELLLFLYQYLTIIDMKGLVLVSFQTLLTNFSQPLPSIVKYSDVLLSVRTSDYIWKRDPKEHVKGKTYLEIENFQQSVIVDEKHIKPHKCDKECNEYQFPIMTSKKCDVKSQDCSLLYKTYANAELRNCTEVDTTLTTCIDTPPRIYKYLKFNNKMYGDKNQRCEKGEKTFTKHKDCSYCVCTVTYKRTSKNHISLRAVVSNILKNRIIVGARFQNQNDIIHIQIKEATLGPFLTVRESRWVPIENFQVRDRMIFANQDYIRVSINSRSIHLADFKMNSKFVNLKNYVMTGVRFREYEGILSLQVRVTRFNLESGSLIIKKGSSWTDFRNIYLDEIDINDADIPRNGSKSTIVNIQNNQFINFTHSSFETDFAQTTVPFFDIQEVVSSGPLHGLGIYYKTERVNNRKSGGFLGIKLLTYDFRDHLRERTNN